MIIEEFYVIQDDKGKFFHIDTVSDGYPYFSNNWRTCEQYNSKQCAENFLKESDYTTRMFKKEFENCVVSRVEVFTGR